MVEKIFALCESITKVEALKLNCEKYKAQQKYDGVRCMAYVDYDGEVILINRSINNITNKFKEIVKELSLFCECVLDGEIISSDGNFNTLQTRAGLSKQDKIDSSKVECYFMAFDILKIGDENLIMKPLKERYKILCDLIKPLQFKLIKIAEFGEIKEMLIKAKENNGEGIVIKDINSFYERRRSKSWLKCKFFQEGYLKVSAYTINNAGIRATDDENNCLQIAGHNGQIVKNLIDTQGYCEICIQYLTESDEGRKRFISYRSLK